jgi:DNA polymerase-2
MLNEIASRTGLPVALDGVYRWVAFLPSRVDARIPVPNRYFGAFQDGSLKMRGIDARRGDTPAWIAEVQLAMLARMAQAATPEALRACLPDLKRMLQRALADLRGGRVPLAKLVASQRLSRELHAYRTPSPAARAAAQLAALGVHLRPGQRARFLYTLGDPGVRAWDLPGPFNPAAVDVRRYRTLLLRAAQTVVEPLGISEAALMDQPAPQEFFNPWRRIAAHQPGALEAVLRY